MNTRILFPALLLTATAFLLQGCAVWEFVDARWQDTTGYFNTYYNASKLYREAEAEITENQTAKLIDPQQASARMGVDLEDFGSGGDDGPARKEQERIRREIEMVESGTPSTAIVKLDKVIEKCSRLLVTYPGSMWVDNALLLIGKSYYHKHEGLRAERKFHELLDGYPESSLVPEAILWLGKTYVRLEKYDTAEDVLERAVQEGIESGDPGLVADAYYEMGKMYLLMNDRQEAVKRYDLATDYARDRDQRIKIYLALAREYERLEDNDKAAAAYGEIFKLDPATDLAFIAELNYAKLKRQAGDLDEASNTMINMLENPMYLDYDGKIQLEIAHLYYAYHKKYLAEGDTLARDAFQAAMEQYTFVDTTFKGKEEASDAGFAKGRIFEKDILDYDKAFENYNKAKTSAPGTPSASRAEGKVKIFGEYRKLRNQISMKDTTLFYVLNPDSLRVRDSLRAIADSLEQEQRLARGEGEKELSEQERMAERFRRRRPHGRNTGRINPWLRELEQQQTAEASGLQATAQAVQAAGPEYRRINLETTDPDSLRSVLASLYMEMGWQMYDRIGHIDSARHYYQRALDSRLSDTLRPQAMYTMAAIERRLGNEEAADRYDDQLIREYPTSRYAHSLMVLRGLPLPKGEAAMAQEAYNDAAVMMERGNIEGGVAMMRSLIDEYPGSEAAAKATLAIAMAFEERRGDEALEIYREMVEEYPESPYSQRGKDILAAIENYEQRSAQREQEEKARTEAERKAQEERKRRELRDRHPLLDEELKQKRDEVREKEEEEKQDPSLDEDFPLRMPGDDPPPEEKEEDEPATEMEVESNTPLSPDNTPPPIDVTPPPGDAPPIDVTPPPGDAPPIDVTPPPGNTSPPGDTPPPGRRTPPRTPPGDLPPGQDSPPPIEKK
ncbi:MAG: tetratricopeptide repeat protein [Bacteroidetes bacterium]|nr:tetratricopeptide repeat protein [Bacteroidota bacterium]